MQVEDARIAVVAAHPDDETLGLGGQFLRPLNVTFIYVTDGSPVNLDDAHSKGFPDRLSYKRARREELMAALRLTGLPEIRIRYLDIPDQQAALHLPEVTQMLGAHLRELRPHLVFTHPFEGGHPDHDAAAYAVQHAAGDIAAIEFTSYHARQGNLVHGEFLCGDASEIVSVRLSEEAYSLKLRMVGCFQSQTDFIGGLFDRRERFRRAPLYDFLRRPHRGPLFYETWNSGLTWPRWIECVEAAR